MQFLVAGKDFLVQVSVYLYAVVLHEQTGRFIVAFALDALHLSQQFSEEFPQGFVIVDAHVGLAFLFDKFHYFPVFALFVNPAGYECTVAHVGLFDGSAGFDAHQLRHEAVHHVSVILAFVGFKIRGQSEFHELLVGYVVKTEEVGARFFYR